MPENVDLALLIAVFGVNRNGKIAGRTRIQKIVCLLQYQAKIPFSFNFKPYYYGPYSDELSEAINTLVGMKLLEEKIIPTRFFSFRYDYELTPKGKQLFCKIKERLEKSINKLETEVETYDNVKTPDLVKFAKEITGIDSISKS